MTRWWWPFTTDADLERDLSESVLRQRHQPQNGADLIAAERQRQVEAEGWTPEHDDSHDDGEMAAAAVCYALGRADITINGTYVWPWANQWWKPAPRLRELVKAGALLAAEIDRLQREAERGS